MTVNERELPTQDDILSCIEALRIKTEGWLSEIDESSENRAFPWAGRTQFGVIIFLLRHMLYHIGELSSLLNDSKSGEAADNWIKAFDN